LSTNAPIICQLMQLLHLSAQDCRSPHAFCDEVAI
jgi:hypothetical protein